MLPLAVTQGDPAGVGPLATIAAWHQLRTDPALAFYVRGNSEQLKRAGAHTGIACPVIEISAPENAAKVFGDALPVIHADAPLVNFGEPRVENAGSIVQSIRACVDDVWHGRASAVVTNPIAKSLLKAGGFPHPGHTEYLAELAGEFGATKPPLPIMMLVGGGLRVALATIHMPLMKVGQILTTDLIRQISMQVIQSLKMDFGLPEARLGLCGLNPHAGEDGMLGEEDSAIIWPAVQELEARGYNVSGPRPGDTIFHEMLDGRYDAIIAMYHDQGLIPVKTLDIWGGVNTTLGLPFIRTSPDHGTAYDAAAVGKVRPDSLIAAIRQASQMALNRKRYEAMSV